MKILLAVVVMTGAAAAAAGVWFRPVRDDIGTRKGTGEHPAPQAPPLSSLSAEDKAKAEELLVRVEALEALLDAHDKKTRDDWNLIVVDFDRENARRKAEGSRIAGVVNSAGGKSVEAQVDGLMDDTARKRMRGVLDMWIKAEVGALRSRLGLAPQQEERFDQIVEDIMKEEVAKIDAEDPGDNFLGWRGDVMESARAKLQERVTPVLTSDQKIKAEALFKEQDWGRAFRPPEESK